MASPLSESTCESRDTEADTACDNRHNDGEQGPPSLQLPEPFAPSQAV